MLVGVCGDGGGGEGRASSLFYSIQKKSLFYGLPQNKLDDSKEREHNNLLYDELGRDFWHC